jgi:hypothetical protein
MIHIEELNSSDVSQRINALLDLEDQRMFALGNIKRRQHIVKTYFNKSVKTVKFKVNEKVLLWDSADVDRGRHKKKFKNYGWVLSRLLLSWVQTLTF